MGGLELTRLFFVNPPNGFWGLMEGSTKKLGFSINILLAFTILPIACIAMLAVITFIPPSGYAIMDGQIWSIGIAFIVLCILGAIASTKPSLCRRYSRGMGENSDGVARLSPTILTSHHPPLPEFSSHVFTLRGEVHCAGCTGLFVGSLVSIVGAILFFFGGFWIMAESPAFWVGFIGISIPILRYPIYRPRHATIRIALGFSFVLGGLLLLVGVCSLSNSVPVIVFAFVVILYFIFSRIVLSQAEHQLITQHSKVANGRVS